ncbi:MAG: transcriptional regulator NrdR [Actinomycetota bacterium]|nr:transcriptional regulator NrdR [Actinomycetota bacterium]
MRCPSCAVMEDRVVDSRMAEDGGAIRRRRECLGCKRRFTTYERIEESVPWVTKRSGGREPFDRSKIAAGVWAAGKNRLVDKSAAEALAASVEEAVRLVGPEVTSERIGREVLERLRALDEVAYLRFASVYKGFEGAGDFQRELGLLTKSSPPKELPSLDG